MNAADSAITFARAQIGKPYQWGATGPNSYDCSGLIYTAYKQAGIQLGRTTYQQIFNGKEVARTDLQPGDLVFPDPGHVQLYSGAGRIIEAPQSGETVKERAMWGFWRARRVTEPGTGVPATAGNNPGIIPVGNPLSDAYGYIVAIFDVFRKLSSMAAWLANPSNWVRIGILLFGALLVFIGLFNFDRVMGVASKAAPVLAKAKGVKNASAT